mmetsp:Transcript_62691/g.161336  ORF Transcript_62691/g.161336 Transcript_62691/m.161336 type:complete len:230 (+) Transcript_62691:62-751(+)
MMCAVRRASVSSSSARLSSALRSFASSANVRLAMGASGIPKSFRASSVGLVGVSEGRTDGVMGGVAAAASDAARLRAAASASLRRAPPRERRLVTASSCSLRAAELAEPRLKLPSAASRTASGSGGTPSGAEVVRWRALIAACEQALAGIDARRRLLKVRSPSCPSSSESSRILVSQSLIAVDTTVRMSHVRFSGFRASTLAKGLDSLSFSVTSRIASWIKKVLRKMVA